jgi:thiol-disulfide isomerase/thioredoxin
MKHLALVLAACSTPAPVKTLRVNSAGAMTDVNAALVADYVTIVDFWSESCGACRVVAEKIAPAIAEQPRVVVREVDVGDGVGPLAHAYDIGALPHYNVYDRERRLRYVLVGNDCLRAPQLARELVAEGQ